MKKGRYRGRSIIPKTEMEVAQYYTFFNYKTPITQRDLKYEYRTIVAGPGMKPAPNFFLLGHIKNKVGKKTPPYALIMSNLETSLDTTLNKASWKRKCSHCGEYNQT